jgi:non-ribosomal peptide synthase protein (TIGR01720 family)
LLDLEGHGRASLFADVDLSRTVGWFTAIYPVALLVQGETAVADLPHIQTQLAQIPWRGIGYGILRYLADAGIAQQMAAIPQPAISFNYLGQFDQIADKMFRVANKPASTTGSTAYAPQGKRPHLLQVNGLVQNGRLHLNLHFSHNLHRPATISQVADRFLGHLRQILQAAQTAPAPPAPAASAVRWPLAPMQTEILAASASAVAGSTAYQVQWQARLHGPLDLSAWRETWTYLLARHAPLRSSFPQSAVATSQAVVPDQLDLPCQILDWSDLSEQTQAERMAALAVPARQQPLSVAAPPLLRLTLIKLGVATYHLLWQYHHLLLDGWSLGLLWPEVTAVYQALTQKQSPDLPPLIPYRRYLDWIGEQPLGPAQAAWQTALGAFRPALTWQVGSTAVFC